MPLKEIYEKESRKCNFIFALLLTFILFGNHHTAQAQCNALSSRRDLFFTPTFGCAPTSVNRFEITYYFTLPQNPADIQIQYKWNDPANTITTIDAGSGLVVGGGNMSFSANATFTYNSNNGQCSIRPIVSIIVAGVLCPTSTQTQTAPYWGNDDQANGRVAMAPNTWDVCFDNPVINAVFRDNSDFNCNIGVEPDNPNRLTRNVQFVYGTNHNPGSTILNLSLVDVVLKSLTDGTGNLVSPQTRGTVGLPVTAGYFGPVDVVPFPADGPTSISFPMNAPANLANLIGNRFEVTLFNWNVCNPWNGDSANPNYVDARITRGYIVIVASPTPSFDAQDMNGNSKRNFCINETIFLANQTPGINGYSYTWEFYDDAAATILLGSSNTTNPTYSYPTGGIKLIRMLASNPSAQGSCTNSFDLTVNITPTLVAKISVTDLGNVPITPNFCQQAAAPLTTFQVRFKDNSVGVVTAGSQWRWEFYDENNALVREVPGPGPGTFSDLPLGPFDLSFINKGIYRVKLITRDRTTGCSTSDEVQVRVYENPVPVFIATRVCEGIQTAFTERSTLNPINGESIVLREWDFNYNGIIFNKDPTFDNQSNFARSLGPAGLYKVALRVTTDQNSCAAILIVPVKVDPLPNASFTPDVLSGCSVLKVTFTNTSVVGQSDIIDRFIWEVDDHSGGGFQPVGTQLPSDPAFSNLFSFDFVNITTINKSYDIRLHVITVNGCDRISSPVSLAVFPGTASGFISTNYSPFNNNCSPQTVNFTVDNDTQAKSPSDYTWQVSNASGLISQTSTGTTPSFNYAFSNPTFALEDFFVKLITTLPSGCFGDSTRIIRISPVPNSIFTVDTLVFDCQILKVQLSASLSGLPAYHWVIQENGIVVFDATSTQDVMEYTFNRPAAASSDLAVLFSLDTKNFANCTSVVSSQSMIIPKKDNINASFTVSPATQSLPASTVTIANTTTPGPWQYLWDFGDGTTSTLSDPTITHTYATYGSYTILLTVTSGACAETQSQTIVIEAIPPIVDFTYDPASGCAPLTVKFTNLSRYADPESYAWDFGYGQATSRSFDPTFTYFQSGTYTVSLSASNITGQTVTATKSMIIEVYPKPRADFVVKPILIYIPGGLLYTSNRSTDASSYLWDFGDGTNSNEPQPEHKYTTDGVFTITLVASNSHGCSDTTVLNNIVRVEKGGQVLIPNAFSPNLTGATGGAGSSNGKNDTFLPLMRGVVEFELLIFNRWGELLFESRDAQAGWDGYYNGRLCPQDVYVYKLTALTENGEKIVRVGDVNLIR